MTHFGYLVAGYALTFASLAGYAAWILSRRRSLAGLLNDGGVPEGQGRR